MSVIEAYRRDYVPTVGWPCEHSDDIPQRLLVGEGSRPSRRAAAGAPAVDLNPKGEFGRTAGVTTWNDGAVTAEAPLRKATNRT